MVWSEQIGVSLIVPTDARPDDPTDTRNYIIIGEDVPKEISAHMTAGLVFRNKSGFSDGWSGTEPLFWALGITDNGGQLEMVAYYAQGSVTEGFTMVAQTMFSMGLFGLPAIDLGGSNGGTYNAGIGGAAVFAADLTVLKTLRCMSTQDASAISNQHPFQIGIDSGLNVIFDNNEIIARNNGVVSPSGLGFGGAKLANLGAPTSVNDAATKTYVDGRTADTGWVSFTPNGPLVAGAGGCKYRVRYGILWLKIHIAYTGAWSAAFTIFTLPAGAKPAEEFWIPGMFYPGTIATPTTYEIKVSALGAISCTYAVPGGYGGVVLTGNSPI